MILKKWSFNSHVGYKILRSHSPEEFFITLAIGLLLKSNTAIILRLLFRNLSILKNGIWYYMHCNMNNIMSHLLRCVLYCILAKSYRCTLTQNISLMFWVRVIQAILFLALRLSVPEHHIYLMSGSTTALHCMKLYRPTGLLLFWCIIFLIIPFMSLQWTHIADSHTSELPDVSINQRCSLMCGWSRYWRDGWFTCCVGWLGHMHIHDGVIIMG